MAPSPAAHRLQRSPLIDRREGDDAAPPALLQLCDPQGYIHAVAQRVAEGKCGPVPVMARDRSELCGFGSLRAARSEGLGAMPVARSIARVRRFLKECGPRDPGTALCLAVDDPFCLAVAALLCLGSRKRFVPLPRAVTPDRIASMARRYSPSSITFVAPALLAPPASSPSAIRFLNSLILALRACESEITLPPFGIITGVDPNAITRVAAKSVLSRPIMDHYADGDICFVSEDGPPGSRKRRKEDAGVMRDPAAPAGVRSELLSTLLPARLPRFAASKRKLLVIKGHGRSYCAGKGLLCTARQITTRPEEPIEGCVANFACIGPPFLQFDPRRFNARILVIDACDAISLQADYWRWGNAAVGFLAAAGHASAVLVGDGMVVPLGENGFELMASLAGCTTMGEWSRQLNAMISGPNPPSSFVLFGDPDLAIAVDPTPWVVDATTERVGMPGGRAKGSWRLGLREGRAPFARVRLGRGAPGGTDALYLWPETAACDVVDSVWVAGTRTQTVWLSVRAAHDEGISLRAERRQPAGFPHAAVEAVRKALDASPHYLDPSLAEAWAGVQAAGARLINLRADLPKAAARTVRQDPDRATSVCAEAAMLWELAQAACVSVVADKVSSLSTVYLPAILWRVEMDTVRTEERRCPLCGGTRLLARDYLGGGSGWRACYDCPRCCFIIDDAPLDHRSVLSRLEAPHAAAPGEPVDVGIWLSNLSADHEVSGALHASVNLTGHGLRPDRSIVRVRLPPRSRRRFAVRLLPTGEPVVPHTYAIRALALVDGLWHWRAHRLVVADPRRTPEPNRGRHSRTPS